LPAARKQPVQKRAEFTVKAIIDAAHELLLKQGVDAVTTRQVAERAGVAIGTLYQYFPDRDAILMRLAYMIMDEEVSKAAHYLANIYRHSLGELMTGLYERSIDVERRMLELGHDFHRRHARHLNFGLYLRDKISNQPQDTEALISAMLRVLSDHREEIGETDRDLASFMIVRGMRNMVVSIVEERPDLLDSPALTSMLTRIAMAIVAGKDGVSSIE
jgi:AcrR family transcriptional regulator